LQRTKFITMIACRWLPAHGFCGRICTDRGYHESGWTCMCIMLCQLYMLPSTMELIELICKKLVTIKQGISKPSISFIYTLHKFCSILYIYFQIL
jgi:hypothetical protein